MAKKADKFLGEAFMGKLGIVLRMNMLKLPQEFRESFTALGEEAVELGIKTKQRLPQEYHKDALYVLKRGLEFGLMTDKQIAKLMDKGSWPEEY